MSGFTGKFFFATALTPAGWHRNVLVSVIGGLIDAVTADAVAPADAQCPVGIALPGMGNLHSHGFQRALAGLTEGASPAGDDFWAWRALMYRFLDRLTPEQVQIITAFAYMEMLEAGFTAVGEFHYLHHDPQGQPYADPGEMAHRILAAAEESGIALTLLPVFYAHGGFGGQPPGPAQLRFVTGLDQYARLIEAVAQAIQAMPLARLGLAPHSLRAVTPDELRSVAALAGDRPIHLHIAEQWREVADCLAARGARPVEWLLDAVPVNPHWCLVHATHIRAAERRRLAQSGAVVGLCPVTEANLGDGVFPLASYLGDGGLFGLGTDSNLAISVTDELRLLDYGQRLTRRQRVWAAKPDESAGRRLFTAAADGAGAALAQPIGQIAPGYRADFVLLDSEQPALAGRSGDRLLDSWIYASVRPAIQSVFVAGRAVVIEGRHIRRADFVQSWRKIAVELAGNL